MLTCAAICSPLLPSGSVMLPYTDNTPGAVTSATARQTCWSAHAYVAFLSAYSAECVIKNVKYIRQSWRSMMPDRTKGNYVISDMIFDIYGGRRLSPYRIIQIQKMWHFLIKSPRCARARQETAQRMRPIFQIKELECVQVQRKWRQLVNYLLDCHNCMAANRSRSW